MDPRRGKATRAPKVDEAAAPKGSARRARATVKESDKSPAWPGDAQSCSSRCGSAKKSESLKKKSAQGLQAKVPQADVLGARSKKATLCSRDSQLLDAATAFPLEDQEPSASPRAPFPRSGHRQEKGAKSARERKCEAGPKKAEALKKSTQGPRARVPQAEPLGARSKTASLCAGDTQALDAAPLEEQEPSASLRAPLSGSGHRGKEGAESALERKSGLGPEELRSSGKAVVCTPSRRASALGVCDLKAVLEKLKLRRQEIILAAEVVNGVVDHLLRRLRSCESAFQDVSLLHAGSYYEHVKISSPNEFDVMFKLDGCRIQLEKYGNTGAFYLVKLKRHPSGNPLSQFLEEEKLSASKMLTKFRSIIKDEIKNIADVAVQRKKRGSPAVTLLITKPEKISVDITLALESKTSWPASTQEGLPIQTWLSGKYRKELRWKPYYLVPKNAKEGNDFQEETWRLSFSHIEKHILNNHGSSRTCCENNGVKCCRKCCLKLMKYLLEQLKKKFEKRKQLSKFCSYHVKTAFFHVCTQFPNDSQWQLEDLNQCFDNCVTYFLNCLRREELNHYFIPSHNLFSRDEIDKESKDFLLQKIVHERSNGFPIFW